jgi:ubiquinone/menaquinone biosynthesis C-methylase UbiE
MSSDRSVSNPTEIGLAPEIVSYYLRASERTRLESGPSQLEHARTCELIERFSIRPPATILDIGGGAGTYSGWLAQSGHEVHLVDAMPNLVEEARSHSESLARPIATCSVGDARRLERSSRSVDIVLLLGPLYHLTSGSDRARALSEARRVLKPGGRLFAAGISRFASALDGLIRNRLADSRFARIVEQDLRDGVHRNDTDRLDYFTTAYFHEPAELQAEIASAGFHCDGIYGIEGPGWLLQDFDDRWDDSRRRAELLETARKLEAEPSLLGVSAHLLVVARSI